MGNFKDVAVIDVLVKPGDAIEVEGPLVTLETEKATMDVPSTVAGIVEKILATKGGTISPGDVVVTVRVEEASATPAAAPAAAPPTTAAAPATAPKAAAPVAEPPAPAHAKPMQAFARAPDSVPSRAASPVSAYASARYDGHAGFMSGRGLY